MVNENFLLDANTFITPYQSYYPFDFAPKFWEQLSPKLSSNNVAILDIVQKEIVKGNDNLSEWIKSVPQINIRNIKDEQIISAYQTVLQYIHDCESYTDKALKAWSQNDAADPWLIAAAITYGYTIITFETPTGKITTASNRPKIPDVGANFGVKSENLFYFMRKMGFKL